MPTQPLRFCNVPGCSHLVISGPCAEHAAQREHGRGNWELRKLYRTAPWRRLRAIVLQEEPTCPECLEQGFITPTQDVHHRHKATPDNFFDRSNLQALCAPHHSEHTQRGE